MEGANCRLVDRLVRMRDVEALRRELGVAFVSTEERVAAFNGSMTSSDKLNARASVSNYRIQRERERDRERDSVCVRERVCVCVCLRDRETERQRERERERMRARARAVPSQEGLLPQNVAPRRAHPIKVQTTQQQQQE